MVQELIGTDCFRESYMSKRRKIDDGKSRKTNPVYEGKEVRILS